MNNEKIKVHMILEILGRPIENVTQALHSLVQKISQEKGAVILEQTIHEPLPVKESKDLFTSFAELVLELDSLSLYFGIMFAYMPANIEIISPEKIGLNNVELSQLGSKLIQRLHDYDAITKKMIYERDIFAGKLREAAPEVFQELVQPQNKSINNKKREDVDNKKTKSKAKNVSSKKRK